LRIILACLVFSIFPEIRDNFFPFQLQLHSLLLVAMVKNKIQRIKKGYVCKWLLSIVAETMPMLKVKLNLLITVCAVGLGAQFQFYSNSVINNVAVELQQWINESYMAHYGVSLVGSEMTVLWSLTSAALQIGAVVGALLTRLIAERLGRRGGLITTGFMCSLGSALTVVAKFVNAFELFIVGRLLLGISLGGSLGLASMFVSELAPVQYRGMCGSMLQIMLGIGSTLSLVATLPEVFGSERLWPVAMGVPLVTSLLQVMIVWHGEESPRFLFLTRKDELAARKSLSYYRKQMSVELQIRQIEKEVVTDTELRNGHGSAEPSLLKQLLTQPQYSRPLLISILIAFGVQFSGIAAVLAFSKTMFVAAGLSAATAKYASVGLGLCSVLTPVISTALIERVGRKVILLSGLALTAVSLVLLMVCVEVGLQLDSYPARVATVPCLFLFQVGFALTSSIIWIVVSELFPQSVRSVAVAVVSFLFFTFQMVVVLAYLPFKEAVGLSCSYLPFVISELLVMALLYKLLPETKGKSIEEISAYFANTHSPSADDKLPPQSKISISVISDSPTA
ncbi:Solute carrier family 2, facilitated glucose transporter member 1, partial [Trichinella zimbabwensis]